MINRSIGNNDAINGHTYGHEGEAAVALKETVKEKPSWGLTGGSCELGKSRAW